MVPVYVDNEVKLGMLVLEPEKGKPESSVTENALVIYITIQKVKYQEMRTARF